MTTQEISARGITTNLSANVEQRLAEVRDRIREFQEAEAVLLKVLDTLRAGGATVPEPRASTTRGKAAAPEARTPAPEPAVEEPSAPARRGRRGAAGAKAPAKSATGRGARRGGRAAETKAEPEPVRVLAFLLPLREPQTAAEIARGLYQDATGQTEIARVRSAAESLTRRGALEKTRQGSTVFYQVATAETGAGSASSGEPTGESEG